MRSEDPVELDLNCLVLGEGCNSIFNVMISDGTKVSDLKKAIMDEKNPFVRLDADALHIFRVSLPDEDGLPTKLPYFRPQHDPDDSVHYLVSPTKRLKTIFVDVVDGHVHVIVSGPSTSIGELSLIFHFFMSAAGQKGDTDDDSPNEGKGKQPRVEPALGKC
jgi:hypothetical protein